MLLRDAIGMMDELQRRDEWSLENYSYRSVPFFFLPQCVANGDNIDKKAYDDVATPTGCQQIT